LVEDAVLQDFLDSRDSPFFADAAQMRPETPTSATAQHESSRKLAITAGITTTLTKDGTSEPPRPAEHLHQLR
jgi:hypothetical protein